MRGRIRTAESLIYQAFSEFMRIYSVIVLSVRLSVRAPPPHGGKPPRVEVSQLLLPYIDIIILYYILLWTFVFCCLIYNILLTLYDVLSLKCDTIVRNMLLKCENIVKKPQK